MGRCSVFFKIQGPRASQAGEPLGKCHPPGAEYLCGSSNPIAVLLCLAWYFCFFPWILCYHAIRVYILPCIGSYANGCCGLCWLAIGRCCCCCCKCRKVRKFKCCVCLEFKDKKFPPDARSIGDWHETGEDPMDWMAYVNTEIDWRQMTTLGSEGKKMKLFSGKVEPADIKQGAIGDCWLMSSLACLAEFDGAIRNLFITEEWNPRGRYAIRLYCGQTKSWETIVVDCMLPVYSESNVGKDEHGKELAGQPIFAKPSGEELWVCLLEKAFAKFIGSYAHLNGGFTTWGLQAMTGDQVDSWVLDAGTGKWNAEELRYRQKKGDQKGTKHHHIHKEKAAYCGKPLVDHERADKNDVTFHPMKDIDGNRICKDGDEFFQLLTRWDKEECVIAASTTGSDEGKATANQGLVQGHAYAVIACIEVTVNEDSDEEEDLGAMSSMHLSVGNIVTHGKQAFKDTKKLAVEAKDTALEAKNEMANRLSAVANSPTDGGGSLAGGSPRSPGAKSYKMLKVRNPWGSFEWEGDWRDDDPAWKQHPRVMKACGATGVATDDGMFWMEWKDFRKYFGMVDVCHRSRGLRDLRLDINEDAGCLGPVGGCACGVAKYFCMCKGVDHLCCPTDHTIPPPTVDSTPGVDSDSDDSDVDSYDQYATETDGMIEMDQVVVEDWSANGDTSTDDAPAAQTMNSWEGADDTPVEPAAAADDWG